MQLVDVVNADPSEVSPLLRGKSVLPSQSETFTPHECSSGTCGCRLSNNTSLIRAPPPPCAAFVVASKTLASPRAVRRKGCLSSSSRQLPTASHLVSAKRLVSSLGGRRSPASPLTNVTRIRRTHTAHAGVRRCLASRSSRTRRRTLSVMDALVKGCGPNLHRALLERGVLAAVVTLARHPVRSPAVSRISPSSPSLGLTPSWLMLPHRGPLRAQSVLFCLGATRHSGDPGELAGDGPPCEVVPTELTVGWSGRRGRRARTRSCGRRRSC